MKKRLLLTTPIVLIIALFLYLFHGCSNHSSPTRIAINPEFGKYISGFTSGLISKNSTIKIQFISSVAKKIKKSDNLSTDLIDFDPGIDGKLYWIDDLTVEFKPSESLPPNTAFVGELKMKDLIEDIKDDLDYFRFSFQTIKQNFDIAVKEQKTIDRKKLKWQKAIGQVLTADDESIERIEKVIKAEQNGKSLNVKWEKVNEREFKFTVDSIERNDNASQVEIQFDGDAIDAEKEGELNIEVPSIKDFKLMSHYVVFQPEQHIVLQYSDPIDENQDLVGMIEIGYNDDHQVVIEDNLLKIYPSYQYTGDKKITIHNGIRNILGYKTKTKDVLNVSFQGLKPAVRLVNKGAILPSSDRGLVFPFEAVNLKAVDIKIIKIYEENIAQFLQVNNMEGNNEIKRVGRPMLRKTVSLENQGVVNFNKWNRFNLDLNNLIKAEPGAIYRITLGFRQQHSLYGCEDNVEENDDNMEEIEDWENQDETGWDDAGYDYSYWDYDYYYYDWDERENPCSKAYYGNRREKSQNIFASDLGIIAKKGAPETVSVFVTNLLTTEPLAGVAVKALNYQGIDIGHGTTNENGAAQFNVDGKPYLIIAQHDTQKGYLKVNDGSALSLSKFDVGGTKITEGLKGFIYGERGVWRPGDSLFVTFVLEESTNPLPPNHPVILEFRNPFGQLIQRKVQKKNNNNFYTFRLKTEDNAPTGYWNVTVQAGAAKFKKSMKIETVKPNRLKINIDFGTKELVAGQSIEGKLNVKWLHGAKARNLKARIDVTLNQSTTKFPKFSDYNFDDPTKQFHGTTNNIFDRKIDNEGNANFYADFDKQKSAPGKLSAIFLTKAFEEGGDFSIDRFSMPFHPYNSYVGIRTPKGDKARGMLLTDTTHRIEMVVVNTDGNRINEKHHLQVSFYKLSWKWWWDKNNSDITNFSNRRNVQPISTEMIPTSNGKAVWKLRVDYPSWGRYLIRVYDTNSGHSTAKIIYMDWPGWAGRGQKRHGEGATMLAFSTDKKKYNVGETVKLNIPSADEGRALISIENGSELIETYWLQTEKGETEFEFAVTKDMTPNVYINVSLLQPHANTANDLPIRMYGVMPINVEDPETHLEPEIKMPDVIESEQTFTVKVSEKKNRPMSYTLAIVDEGLLDLTRYKTPDPWKAFNAREALGVKTWDMYDWVIGAYGGDLERLLSIGGDDEMRGRQGKKANRFKPVVMFLGPFYLKSGEDVHKIKMPKYIGSVRAMVVAGNNNAYGSAEKAVPVRKPLMVLATLPRVLGPGEQVKLPVTIFAMEKDIKNVKVQVKTNDKFIVNGSTSKSLNFNEPGEDDVTFDLTVKPVTGIGKVEVIATSGNKKSTYEIELDVRNPNPKITHVISGVLQAGNTLKQDFKPVGIAGTNKIVMEVSSLPALNLEKRLRFLIRYPHGCVEQTTSGAFPQLYLASLIELDKERKNEIERNVKAAIKQLKTFQLASGGLGYWPNSSNISDWGTNYAGHFLVEAENNGYYIGSEFMNKWKKFQRRAAKNWIDRGSRSQLVQAYRLYTLALADKAEIGAMNRLRETPKLSETAQWRLAAAYYLAGKSRIADKMIENLNPEVKEYTELSYTFGSALRDKAMILETMSLMNKKEDAYQLLKEVAGQLGTERWYSTQTTAYSLIAISKYVDKGDKSKIDIEYSINGGEMQSEKSKKPVVLIEIPHKGVQAGLFKVKNNSSGVLFTRLLMEGVPQTGEETDASNKLKLEVAYANMSGNKIDPQTIAQGTDFIAYVTVKHPGYGEVYKEVALTQIFPSGWEIINTRLLDIDNYKSTTKPKYRDIRDDRVYTYFDLNKAQSSTFEVRLNAAYQGKFYLPAVYAETMYDASINARKKGMWVKVVSLEDFVESNK